MTHPWPTAARRPLVAGLAALALAGGGWAAPASAQTAAASASPSDKMAVNLVRLLVQKGVISQEQGAALITQAEQETAQATGELPPAAPGVIRVPYVPQVVRDQIREELKADVIAQARAENWAAPNTLPAWTRSVTFSGDLRARSQFEEYDKHNTNEFIDFAAFNAGGPTDVNPDTNPNGLPFLNTRQNRNNQWSLRARLAMDATVSDTLSVGLRLASGRENGPVSTTQLLGGGFAKKDIWLDRAFVTVKPVTWAGLTLGRMPNPFYSTDLLFDEDLNFDGAAANASRQFNGIKLGLTAGAFPVEYGSSSFPSNDINKGGTLTKWMYGVQFTAAGEHGPVQLKGGAAYYSFQDARGQLSAPCALYTGIKQCSTDQTRPASMQKGNTLFLLRDIQADPSNPLNFAQPQFVGLAMNYDVLDLTGEVSARVGQRYLASLNGDYVRNLAYDAKAVCRYPTAIAVNNINPSPSGNLNPCSAGPGDTKAVYYGGDTGWQMRAGFGTRRQQGFGDWRVFAGYRYLQTDAVLDSFTDSDFHLGGTNAQGYFLGGAFLLDTNLSLGGRWLSANEIDGPPLSIDVGQIDLNVRF